mmetsp:Transcript_27006/g.43643  ORF Transcript_27006/g.43643 Transcript_27006/m.43643 type:complete len:238 (+) Transcript_27006:91-804(+)
MCFSLSLSKRQFVFCFLFGCTLLSSLGTAGIADSSLQKFRWGGYDWPFKEISASAYAFHFDNEQVISWANGNETTNTLSFADCKRRCNSGFFSISPFTELTDKQTGCVCHVCSAMDGAAPVSVYMLIAGTVSLGVSTALLAWNIFVEDRESNSIPSVLCCACFGIVLVFTSWVIWLSNFKKYYLYGNETEYPELDCLTDSDDQADIVPRMGLKLPMVASIIPVGTYHSRWWCIFFCT